MGRFLTSVGLVAVLSCLAAAAAWAEEGEAPADPVIAPVPDGAMYVRQPAWQSRRHWKKWILRAELGIGCIQGPGGVMGQPLAAGVTGLDWGEMDCSKTLAGRLTVGYRLGGCGLVELRGTVFGERSGDTRQSGFFAYDNLPGISPPVSATLENESSLWTVELNYWRRLGGNRCFKWRGGLGVRYVDFDDEAIARDWVGLAPSSFLESEAENSLFAGQLLGAVAWTPGRRWAIQASGRLFGGSLNRQIRINEDSILSGGVKAAEDETTEFGWGFELGLDVRYRFSRCFSVSAGYAYLFMADVARGSDSMDFSQAVTGAVQARQGVDDVAAHALFLGIQVDL